MSDKLLHEELDDIFREEFERQGYIDGRIFNEVWQDVRITAMKKCVTHILKSIGPRPTSDDIGSGLAKIAAAMAKHNRIDEARLDGPSIMRLKELRKGL